MQAVARAESDLAAAAAELSAAEQKGVAAKAEAQRLEKEIGDFAQDREKRLKTAEKAMKEARAALATGRAGAKAMEDRAKSLAAERAAAADERAGLEEQLAAAAATVKAAAAEASAQEAKVAKRKAAYEACSAALEGAKERARACDRELSDLVAARSALEKGLEEKQLEHKKTELKVTRLERDAREAEERVARLLHAHPWIAAERTLFGRAGGDYDWKARSPEAAQKELAALEADQEKLSKTVNKKVLGMFDKAESEYKELTEKRRIVLNDKSKIEAVIHELDEKKKEALVATWQQVNRDFGSIFSTLLPGTSAKLEPPEGGSCLDGLEVRVAFGSVWKQSLTELSGGQRSLLALSLILALLLFKVRARGSCVSRAAPDSCRRARTAGANLHPGRGRCGAGPEPHAEHWAHDPHALPLLAVHRGVAEGGHVQQRKRDLPHKGASRPLAPARSRLTPLLCSLWTASRPSCARCLRSKTSPQTATRCATLSSRPGACSLTLLTPAQAQEAEAAKRRRVAGGGAKENEAPVR